MTGPAKNPGMNSPRLDLQDVRARIEPTDLHVMGSSRCSSRFHSVYAHDSHQSRSRDLRLNMPMTILHLAAKSGFIRPTQLGIHPDPHLPANKPDSSIQG